MSESRANEVRVQISAKEEKAHLMLLEAMYKFDTLDNASVDELLDVLRLAHKYEVKYVLKKCKYCLQAMAVSVEICDKIMHFIKVECIITDFDDLVELLQSFLAKEFSPLDTTWQTTSFTELCEPSIKYLLSSDKLVAESENTVFHALMHWIEHHGIENVLERKELPSLLLVIRFEQLTADYLYNIVQHHTTAKKLPDFTDHYLRGISYRALSNEIKENVLKQQAMRPKTQSVVAYTWDIPRDKLRALIGTQNELKSDEFWFCGYRMGLIISDVVQNEKVNEFGAKLSLEMMDLTEYSIVDMLWRSLSESFLLWGCDAKKEKFKKSAPVSSVNIKYQSEKKRHNSKNTSSSVTALSETATTLFASPGLNTTSPTTTTSTPSFGNPGPIFTHPKTTSLTPSFGNPELSFTSPKTTTSTPSFGSPGPIFTHPKTTSSTPSFGNPGPIFTHPKTTSLTPSFGNPELSFTSPTTTSLTPSFGNPGPIFTHPKTTSLTPSFGNPELSFTSPKTTSLTQSFGNPGPIFTHPKTTSSTPSFDNPGPIFTHPKITTSTASLGNPGPSYTSPKTTSSTPSFGNPGPIFTHPKATSSTPSFGNPGPIFTHPKITTSTASFGNPGPIFTHPKTTSSTPSFDNPGPIFTHPKTTTSTTPFSNPGPIFTHPKTTTSTPSFGNPEPVFTHPKTTSLTPSFGNPELSFTSPKTTSLTPSFGNPGPIFTHPKTTSSTPSFDNPGPIFTHPKITTSTASLGNPGPSYTSPKTTTSTTPFGNPGPVFTHPKTTSSTPSLGYPGPSYTSSKATTSTLSFGNPGLSFAPPKTTTSTPSFGIPGPSYTSSKATTSTLSFGNPFTSSKTTTLFASPGFNTIPCHPNWSTTTSDSPAIFIVSTSQSTDSRVYKTITRRREKIRSPIQTDNPRTNKLPKENCLSIDIKMKLLTRYKVEMVSDCRRMNKTKI